MLSTIVYPFVIYFIWGFMNVQCLGSWHLGYSYWCRFELLMLEFLVLCTVLFLVFYHFQTELAVSIWMDIVNKSSLIYVMEQPRLFVSELHDETIYFMRYVEIIYWDFYIIKMYWNLSDSKSVTSIDKKFPEIDRKLFVSKNIDKNCFEIFNKIFGNFYHNIL